MDGCDEFVEVAVLHDGTKGAGIEGVGGSRQRVLNDFEKLAKWSKENDRTVCIGEFGVDATYALEEDRLRWILEIRELCDQCGFIWQYWSYDNRLRLSVGEPGERVLEKPVFDALGLGSL